MPIYDYHCASCGQTTEVIHGIDAPAPRFCPVCGAEGTLRKAFAAPAVLFKGSGWAKKDRSSASGSRSKPSSSSSGNDSSDATAKAAGTDSKAKSGDAPPASKTSGSGED